MIAIDIADAFCLYPIPGGTVAALRGLSLTSLDGACQSRSLIP